MRWAVGLIGLINAVISIRELLTRPDRDVWVEKLGSVVSLHSIYLGVAAACIVVVLACSSSFLTWLFEKALWVREIPKRRRELEQERVRAQRAKAEQGRKQEHKKRTNRKTRIVKTITDLREFLEDPFWQNSPIRSQTDTEILLLKQDLINANVAPERHRDATDAVWRVFLEGVLPQIIQYGVKYGVARYESVLERQE